MKYLCESIKKIVYADDTTLVITGKNKLEALEKCKNVLKNFNEYFKQNKLTVNAGKTKYMTFNNKTNKNYKSLPRDEDYIILDSTPLEEVNNFKLLGVIINNKLSWEDHKKHVKSKISKSLGILYNSRNILHQKDIINI